MISIENIVVSICCQTYNHKNYISQAIDGFLMQKTNFKFEILLRDDASTDGTTDIVKEYSAKYPDIIKPLIYEENQYVKGVSPFMDNVKRSTAKYIALCEGDDYWTDPLKLQKQVDFLEGNEEYVCVGGKVQIKDTRNEFNKLQYGQQYFEYNGSQEVPKEDILDKVKLPFHTSTFLFRRSAFDLELFKLLFKHSISGDIPILNMLNAKGKIFFINEEFAVKHHNSGGITTTQGHKGLNFLWNRVYMWEQISKLYNQDYLRNLANDNNKYFKGICMNKFLNVKLADQIGFYRNTTILHRDLIIAIFETLVKKVLLKFRLKY